MLMYAATAITTSYYGVDATGYFHSRWGKGHRYMVASQSRIDETCGVSFDQGGE